jgi:small ligand-binding sensory domain FIST
MPPLSRIGSAVSRAPAVAAAIDEAWCRAAVSLPRDPDMVVVFASGHHAERAVQLYDEVVLRAPTAVTLGCCVADGVIGPREELEEDPAVAIWLACFPEGATLLPFHLSVTETAHGELNVFGWPDLSEIDEGPTVIAVADPYTFPVEGLLSQLDGIDVVGGLAGLGGPGKARLLWSGGVETQGAVGVALVGVPVASVVSQGARPIGPELIVTAAERNAVLELAGRPAVEKLAEVVGDLPPGERDLALRGLMIGLVIDENQAEHGVGDFLVRGLVGLDEERGALLIGDVPRVGQMLRFHVRDEQSADEELHHVLERPGPASGALLFSCNGRGSRMFSAPDHDARLLDAQLCGAPVAGMFCQGEIGPVGGRAFVHGFTATMAVFG